ncbi:iron-containing alcohol dehydrogenase [Bacillus sp. RAR_GA_16]|uniref:iron-containing alcohol dehydrogenase n=1 Tax=Bacillus sp. RAR_GA_16 TaxID=2876774 RepID=UPI001CCAFF31|nr:iron-containing alcohol dehydrogenase [Bacillus sp. RAR_GA_16]MCA0170696.1 iron-containing alcohol dehydrogenase [Bacillus sp. RAR_GA_16]
MSLTYSQYMLRTAIHRGAGTRALVPDLFKGLEAKRVVLFSDRGLEQAGIVEKIKEIFELTPHGTGPELAGVYLDIHQDAGSKDVNAALKFAREVSADGLLAVGGGSVMDTVKGVKYALHHGITDIKEAIPGGLLYLSWPEATYMPIPHISIPTTAGTGSEVSPIAVIYNEEIKMKTNIIHPFINADMAILDPELTTGLPAKITAFTGFDALTHAIEALASPTATALTDAYALQSIRLIESHLPIAVKHGENLHARMEMLQASMMSITAFSFALNAIPVHNFAHAYGALFRIPHGLANAVFLPVVMASLPDLYLPKIKELAEALHLETSGKEKQVLLKEVIAKIQDMQQNIGLPANFKDYSIPPEALDATVAAVKMDPAALNYPLPPELIKAVGEQVIHAQEVSV